MSNTHPECTDLGNCRTVSSIVWTCLATLFLCTWACIHPNVPGFGGTAWTRLRRRMALMLVMVIAPEIFMYSAMKQFVCARTFSQRHNLSLIHGFFFHMGGFAKYTDKGICYLIKSPNPRPKLEEMETASQTSTATHSSPQSLSLSTPSIRSSAISTSPTLSDIELISTVTSDNLQARSRSDALTKGIAAIQISWFIAQCIARAVDGLAITELEISTAAFALLTVVTYGFWWGKPFDVAEPIILNRPEAEHTVPSRFIVREKSWKEYRLPGIVRGLSNFLLDAHFDSSGDGTPFHVRGVRFLKGKSCENGHPLSDKIAVPARWSGDDADFGGFAVHVVAHLVFFLSVCFGAIHCTAWGFVFPTMEEKWLWRASSLTIMLMPGIGSAGMIIMLANVLPVVNMDANAGLGSMIVEGLIFIGLSLYVIARLSLLVLPFTALRALPPTAYHTVDWLKFVPHFG